MRGEFQIRGQVQGAIWWPVGAVCTKEFDVRFTREQRPFRVGAETLRDALLHVTNDGDFQGAVITYALLSVERTKGSRRVIRTVELSRTGDNADLFATEDECVYPELED